jgi:putative transposase
MACICAFPVCPWGGPPKGCCLVKRNHVSVWSWIQKYKPRRLSSRKRVSEFIDDETLIKAGSEYVWLRVAIEPKGRRILALTISKERSMFVEERFLRGLVGVHGKHPVSTDGGSTRYGTRRPAGS